MDPPSAHTPEGNSKPALKINSNAGGAIDPEHMRLSECTQRPTALSGSSGTTPVPQ